MSDTKRTQEALDQLKTAKSAVEDGTASKQQRGWIDDAGCFIFGHTFVGNTCKHCGKKR